jgi:ATP-dependent Clp protease ATP-binding subunit ClpC
MGLQKMFERYTDEAKKAIYYGAKAAMHQSAAAIDSMHLLLGLVTEDDSRANRIFGLAERLPNEASQQSEFEKQYNEWNLVIQQTPPQSIHKKKTPPANTVPMSAEGKRILAHAAHEANGLRDYWIGSEHLVLGILREGDSAAAARLRSVGLDLEAFRKRVLDNQGSRPPMPDPVLFWVRRRPIGFALGFAFMLGITTALVLLGAVTAGILFTIACLTLFGLPRYVRRRSLFR